MKTVFNYDLMAQKVAEWSKIYQAAKPYPYIALDGLADEKALSEALQDVPAPEDPCWFDCTTPQKTVQLKQALWDIRKIPANVCRVLYELNSGPFVEFIEALSGISHLVPDPHFFGAGLHQVLPGGKLEIHADHNINVKLNLYRRVSVALYLNKNWRDEYNGALELWPGDKSGPQASVTPVFNRIMIFSNSETSFHGHPTPIACPPGMTRKSLAAWYLAPEPDPSYSDVPHKATFPLRETEQAGAY